MVRAQRSDQIPETKDKIGCNHPIVRHQLRPFPKQLKEKHQKADKGSNSRKSGDNCGLQQRIMRLLNRIIRKIGQGFKADPQRVC